MGVSVSPHSCALSAAAAAVDGEGSERAGGAASGTDGGDEGDASEAAYPVPSAAGGTDDVDGASYDEEQRRARSAQRM